MSELLEPTEYIANVSKGLLDLIFNLEPSIIEDIKSGNNHVIALGEDEPSTYAKLGLKKDALDWLFINPELREILTRITANIPEDFKVNMEKEFFEFVEEIIKSEGLGYEGNESKIYLLLDPNEIAGGFPYSFLMNNLNSEMMAEQEV